ncbi:MAG TPA: type I-PGING CRISPR-associated protein Cas5p [Saprospiraceae bacterium]|nr:type I-PGING CRISPR-associated protein Cas5p [Saprospiraceae bacterium]MBK6666593.1 type I-PGING CRISPR-associated protein Cas5p [Saprospiraceae bacterium]MBK7700654.1 type I-PGING CRISPR-associated protein Cas5p [Saprospiraceae bacterium]MBK8828329.1 type I-PGING CRISPR-associated protein Cas5p [Saprospiraceae bacterium]MBK8887119.1 type I-PGING CRISPR-associated protein Cas5p [Saprospiraceae bacterium]
MTNKIDLSFIFNEPKLTIKSKLTIQPLAPLSMVADIPGSYYKTQEVPDKLKLCGLFENIIGWHFDKIDRIAIHKKRREVFKKVFKKMEYHSNDANSGYQPLVYDYFETGLVVKFSSIQYNDLWKRAFSRLDAYVHANGTPNLDYELLKEKPRDVDNKGIEKFLKENKTKFPMFYTSPTLREYIDYDGNIQIGLSMCADLYNVLQHSLTNNSTAFLGNSEGWVELKLEEI